MKVISLPAAPSESVRPETEVTPHSSKSADYFLKKLKHQRFLLIYLFILEASTKTTQTHKSLQTMEEKGKQLKENVKEFHLLGKHSGLNPTELQPTG